MDLTMSRFPPAYFVEPAGLHTSTIILLHGRGSNGKEFAEEFFEAQSSDGRTLTASLPGARWVFPTSKERHSTVFQEDIREWFDIYSLSDPEQRQELQLEGLQESVAHVLNIVNQEVKTLGANPARLVLGGISQGGAVSILSLLAGKRKLGAFVGFCTWLPFKSQLEELAAAHERAGSDNSLETRLDHFFKSTLGLEPVKPCDEVRERIQGAQLSGLGTPCFLSQCADDDVVDVRLGQQLRDVLRKLSAAVTWDEHEHGGHWIQEPEGFDHLLVFLSSQKIAAQAS